MFKTKVTKFQRFTSGLAVLGLIVQALVPGLDFSGVPRAFAASNTWDFSTAGDYTASSKVTISGTGGYAALDLDFAASSDNLDSYGPTQDLVQTATGRVIAAVGTADFPRSDNSGSTWSVSGTAFLSPLSATDLKVSGSNVIAAGSDGAGAPVIVYSSNDGDSWTAAIVLQNSNNTSVNDISTTVGGKVYAVTSNNAGNGQLLVSSDNGQTWAAASARPSINAINTVQMAGSRIFAAGSGFAYDGTTDETGVFYSDDDGTSWTQAFTTSVGNTHTNVSAMAYDATAGVLYATTNAGYILKSSVAPGTGTPTFTRVTATNVALATDIFVTHLSGVVSAYSDIFVTLSNGKLMRSVDGGSNFFSQNTDYSGLTSGYANKIIRIDTNGAGSADDKFLLAIRNDGSNGDAYIATYATSQHVYNNTGTAYASISAFTETMSSLSETAGLKYRISKDGATWKYWDGAAWSTSDNLTTKINSASTINTNIGTFASSVGTGSFYFDAVFTDYGGPSSPASAVNPSMILDSVAITYTSASITVISPNGPGGVDDPTPWYVGSTHDITWSSSGLGAGNIITLSYSIDSGSNWLVIDGTDGSPTANDGSYPWTLPTTTSDTALVKVASGAISDTSDAVFRIIPAIGQGTGCETDTTIPTSDVNDLTEYNKDLPFTVRVMAGDPCGIAGVNLYYTYNTPAHTSDQLIQFGDTKHGCPLECFTWNFNAPYGDGLYRFYSSAVDGRGNDNWDSKYGDGPGKQYYFTPEAWTRVDTVGPHPSDYSPTLGATDQPTVGDITLLFNERTQPDRFDYHLYKLVSGHQVDATDKLDAPEWLPTDYYEACPPEVTFFCAPSPPQTVYDQKVRLHYHDLENGVKYYFTIRHILDKAGNDVVTNFIEPDTDYTVWATYFTTVVVIDPNLTQSNIEITNTPVGGKFDPGSKVSFKVTLINSSTFPSTTTATIPIADGLTYCSTAPCSPPAADHGQQPTVIIDGGHATIIWTGMVILGTDVVITFDAKVNNPSYLLSITQEVDIDDGLHDTIYPKYVTLAVKEHADFSTSTKTGTCFYQGKTQTCTDAVVGTAITYTIAITNTGTTPSNRMITDGLGSQLGYVSGPTGDGWDGGLSYDSESNSILASAIFLPGQTKTFSFIAVFTPTDQDEDVVNIANISDSDFSPRFTTHVPGISSPPDFSPQIVFESPGNGDEGVAPDASIQVAFSKSIDPTTFAFSITEDGTDVDSFDWSVDWSDYNGIPDAQATIAPPAGVELDTGAEYAITIDDNTADTDGNTLASGTLPNPWSFITTDPAVKIAIPTDPVVRLAMNEVSPEFVVQIQDQSSGNEYKVPEDIQIALQAQVPATGKPGHKRQTSTTGLFATSPDGNFVPSPDDNLFHITIPAGSSKASFYFKDSVEVLDDIFAFVDPANGHIWSAGEKPVLVSGVEPKEKLPRLEVDFSDSTMKPGQFSRPMVVRATSATDDPMLLPETLYFYTESTTGRFFDSSFHELHDYITTQAVNPMSNLQYADNVGGSSATFYYMDTVPQSSLLTISDNAPLNPDTGLANANLIANVLGEQPDDILQELEPVIDDTGRVLDQVLIDPTKAVLLPGGAKVFGVKALDKDGKEIDNAKFKWYVTAGGGTIEKDGIDDKGHTSIFTAGQDLGSFYDTIIVATLYNGEFGFASASIRVSDIVEYTGPARLPTTGVSGIQLIFMALTLMAAVALAWVEHYDKTHFSKN